MDKNVLAEYQKRVEEILETLGTYQVIISEGIEEAQSRTDSRLSELQVRREELNQPVDMSDVSATVIDRRESISREYNDDREGYLLSEYDKRRLDGYEGPKFTEIVDEIRTIRERKRLAEIEVVEEEMQELIEEQSDINHAREAEADKNILTMQLQEEIVKIEDNIQKQKDKIAEEMGKFEESYEEGKVHLQALTLYKDKTTSRVYTAAKAEHEKCIQRAESAQNKVKRLSRIIAHLEQDLGDLEQLTEKLYDSKEMDEISKQEDKMWEDYRKEQKEQDSKKEEEIDHSVWEYNYDEQLDEKFRKEDTQKEINEYGQAGENPLGPLGPYRVPLKEKEEGTKPQEPVQSQQTSGTKPPVPPAPGRKSEEAKMPNGPFKIAKAGLKIADSGLPTYYVELTDAKGELVGPVHYEQNNGYYKVIVPGREQEPELQQLQSKFIAYPRQYYDFGLAGLLKEVDGKYGTTGAKDYIEMLKEKDKPVDTRKDLPFDIDYDLSKLNKVHVDPENEDKIKYLKKIASKNAKAGLATYKKVPGIFDKIASFVKEIMSKIKTPRIMAANPIEQPPIVNQDEKKNTFKQSVVVQPQELSSTSKLHYISAKDNLLKIGDDGAVIIKAYLNGDKPVEQFIEEYEVEDELANMLRTTPREQLVITDKKRDMGKIAKEIATISTFITISRGAQEAVDNFIKNSVQDQELENILRTSSIEELREKVEELKGRKDVLKDEIAKLQEEEEIAK